MAVFPHHPCPGRAAGAARFRIRFWTCSAQLGPNSLRVHPRRLEKRSVGSAACCHNQSIPSVPACAVRREGPLLGAFSGLASPVLLSGCDAHPGLGVGAGPKSTHPSQATPGRGCPCWLASLGLCIAPQGARGERAALAASLHSLLTLFTTTGWIPSGSEAAWAERKAGFGLQPLLPQGSSSSSRTSGLHCRQGQGEGMNSQRPLEAGSCLQANNLCAEDREECRARARRDSFETEL